MTANRGGGFGFPAGYFDEYGEVARPSAVPLDPATAAKEQAAHDANRLERKTAEGACLYEVLAGPLQGRRVRGPSPFKDMADWMLRSPGAKERALRMWSTAMQRVVREDGSEFETYTAVLGSNLKEVT